MYTAPLLTILLDFGTNNRELLNDPLHLGLRQTRPTIQETEPFVDEFVNQSTTRSYFNNTANCHKHTAKKIH
jgi:hypothetical protein